MTALDGNPDNSLLEIPTNFAAAFDKMIEDRL